MGGCRSPRRGGNPWVSPAPDRPTPGPEGTEGTQRAGGGRAASQASSTAFCAWTVTVRAGGHRGQMSPHLVHPVAAAARPGSTEQPGNGTSPSPAGTPPGPHPPSRSSCCSRSRPSSDVRFVSNSPQCPALRSSRAVGPAGSVVLPEPLSDGAAAQPCCGMPLLT